MTDGTFGNIDALAGELRALGRLIGEAAAPAAGAACVGASGVLALTRLVRGMGPDDWFEMASRNGLSQWLALPVAEQDFPLLSHLLATLDDLAFRTEHDALTGLANANFFTRRLEKELDRVNRDGAVLSMALLSIDDLDGLTGRFGPAWAERVFMELARTMGRVKRPYDLAARLGENLFGLILPGARPHNVCAMLERLQAGLAASFACSGGDGSGNGGSGNGDATAGVSFCAGHTTCVGRISGRACDFHELATAALTQARRKGAGCIQATKLPDESFSPQATMVHSDEKKFLFSGI